MTNQKIVDVWSFNFTDELKKLDSALYNYRVVSLDTEFPGFLVNTPRQCSDFTRYLDLKTNVDPMKIIQIGLTLSDKDGTVGGSWQFNFSFSTETDVHSIDSIEFLKESGIDFEKLKTDGIDGFYFSNLFWRVLAKHRRYLQWVTFHGLYDLGHLVKLLTNRPLPNLLENFILQIRNVIGHVVDLKYMATLCKGLRNGQLGLQKMSDILGVERVGSAHQAGSDSLLTSLVFAKVKEMYEFEESEYIDYLYGIDTSRCRSQQQLVRGQVKPSIPYCQLQSNTIFMHPMPPPVVCAFYAMHPVNMVNQNSRPYAMHPVNMVNNNLLLF